MKNHLILSQENPLKILVENLNEIFLENKQPQWEKGMRSIRTTLSVSRNERKLYLKGKRNP